MHYSNKQLISFMSIYINTHILHYINTSCFNCYAITFFQHNILCEVLFYGKFDTVLEFSHYFLIFNLKMPHKP